MKNLSKLKVTILILIQGLLGILVNGQNLTITVSGSYIIGVCGDTIILRGVNYSPYNWSNDETNIKFSEIAQSGANCVRIPWYTSSAVGGGYLYDDLSMLDTAISRCIHNKMIPIVELQDLTGNPDYTLIPALAQWYLQPEVLFIINRFAHNLIINIANEAGNVQNSQQLVDFQNTYQGVVTTLRNGGITVPLMIDAPNNGTDIDLLSAISPALEASDPINNLIFSAHAYWYYYANNDSVIMRNKIVNALSTNVPIVMGEVSRVQDGTVTCELSLNYQPLLKICQQLHVSWLAWIWDHDICPARQMSNDGNFNNLSTFGNNIVYNGYYGLMTHSILTTYLKNSQSCTEGVHEVTASAEKPLEAFSADGEIIIRSLVSENLTVNVYDMTGRKVNECNLTGLSTQRVKLPSGVYLISTAYKNQMFSAKTVR